MQHKRKTNHERFEEDRNKLAIGYRLSAIGYRLILGVLISVFAATAFAANCKVNDTDISDDYVGGCVNGLAHGKGKAIGRDTYDGEFKQGNKHGKGIYTWAGGDKFEGDWLSDKQLGRGVKIWANGSKYDGEYLNGKRHGFGKLSVVRGDEAVKFLVDANLGKWQADNYLVEGIFDNNRLTLSCTSPQNCKQEQAKREAQERDRVANACNTYYQGKSIGFKPAGWSYFGATLDAVVLGKGNGNVSLKIVDRNFTDLYGKTLEMSCTSDQLQ